MLVMLAFLAACGGGGGGGDTSTPIGTPGSADPPSSGTSPPPPTAAMPTREAHRFLRQTTFGIAPGDVEALQASGYEDWIAHQQALPPSLHLTYVDGLPEPENNEERRLARIDAWFHRSLNAPDQLRQRVAFALSEIMVVSDTGPLGNAYRGVADYYDVLVVNAFGNFRDLMQDVTLHPVMGVYLSMLGNEKPDPAKNIRPDENYARELMQLFTIGLVELNIDGTMRLDDNNQPIPTYNQAIIEGFAHVWTGWTYAGSPDFKSPRYNFVNPMAAYPAFHDTGTKTLLNGVTLPAGQTPEKDLEDALDNIFSHQNVAPFVSRQLIQRLVTVNPSPAYVARIASVFNDNGSGTRGDLGAVVSAILMDEEARSPTGEQSGKLVEPLLRLTALWRAYDAKAPNGRYMFYSPENAFAQAPLRAPSVFNFFSPFYAPIGEISDAGLVSPEMQITNETTTASVNNYLAFAVYLRNQDSDTGPNDITIDFSDHLLDASDDDRLVASVAIHLLGRDVSPALRTQINTMLELIPADEPQFRIAEVINAIISSPEYATLE